MRVSPVLPLLFALSVALTACEHNTDLIAKLNDEPLGHTNASNIAAMVANPADLIRGHGGGPVDAAVSVLPIDRFEADRLKPLPDPGGSSGASGSSTSGSGSSGSGSSGSGSAGGASGG
jgi:type IV pilus biogenesis protein CpaD/CtpE